MKIDSIFILFWLYAFLGWIIETIIVSIKSKKFVNRGFLIGPYCPIYGFGGVILLLVNNYSNAPLIVFIVSIFVCSLVEYLTSYLLELIFKVRWWDYSDRFMNMNGRICLFNSICFGVLGLLGVCYLNPFFLTIINNLQGSTRSLIASSILIVTLIDITMTTSIMFDIRKTIISLKDKTKNKLFKPTDNTEEISKKVRNILKERSFIHRHLSKAYSNFIVYKDNFLQKTSVLVKKRKLENEFILSSFLSLGIGLILGYLFKNIVLLMIICFSINIVILKIKKR